MVAGSAILVAVVVIVAVVFAIVLVVLRKFLQGLRARGRAAIDARYPATDVLLSETLAQSYGEESKGVTQVRGNGALALTRSEIFFLLYVPERELRIPVASIQDVTHPRSHLGKSGGARLLHVRWTRDGASDAIAWRVPDPDAWKAKIDALRG